MVADLHGGPGRLESVAEGLCDVALEVVKLRIQLHWARSTTRVSWSCQHALSGRDMTNTTKVLDNGFHLGLGWDLHWLERGRISWGWSGLAKPRSRANKQIKGLARDWIKRDQGWEGRSKPVPQRRRVESSGCFCCGMGRSEAKGAGVGGLAWLSRCDR